MQGLFLAGLLLLGGSAAAPPASPRSEAAAPPAARPALDDQMDEGRSLLDNGHYDEAIEIFNRVLSRVPDFGPALASRALAYASTNRLVEASRDLDVAARTMPDSGLLHRARGLVAQRRSDDETARAEYSRSLELEPGNESVLEARAFLLQAVGEQEAALADADTAIRAHPDNPDAYVLRANLLIGRRQRAPAEAEAARLIGLFPDNPYAQAAAARIYAGLADRDQAMAAVNRAVALGPDEAYYRLLRADVRRWDDLAGRRADLVAGLALDPNNNDAITELGLLDFRERKWSDAIERFSAVLAVEPRDFGVLAYRSMTHLNAGRRALAEQDFRTASTAASGPDDLSLLCQLFAQESLALDWAMEACDRAVALNDHDSSYRASRGLAELRLGRLDAALADYEIALRADLSEADGYYGRALVHRRRGEQAAAATDHDRALAINPGIDEIYRSYGFTDF